MDVVMMGRRPYIKWRLSDMDVEIVLAVLKDLALENRRMGSFANCPLVDRNRRF